MWGSYEVLEICDNTLCIIQKKLKNTVSIYGTTIAQKPSHYHDETSAEKKKKLSTAESPQLKKIQKNQEDSSGRYTVVKILSPHSCTSIIEYVVC